MSEVLGSLHDNHISRDDLLTDAVSEFMKFKAELSDLDFLGENMTLGDLLSDEMLSNSYNGEEGSVLSPDSDFPNSAYSSSCISGITSGASQHSPIKMESSGNQLRTLPCTDSTPAPKKLRIEIHRESPARDTKLNSCDLPFVKANSSLRASLPVVSDSSHRVRLVVQPSQSSKVQSTDKLDASQHVYSNFKTFNTAPRPRFQHQAMEPKNRSTIPSGCKRVPHIVRSPESSLHMPSPLLTDQHSSSDSDHRDSFDDDGVAAFSEVYFDSSAAPIARSTYDIPKNHGFSHSDGYASQLQISSNVHCSEFSDTEYLRGSRLSSHHVFFRGQINPRIRSPLRLDRNESGVLILTEEEKRTLLAEGYGIPTRLPLSKQDERNLKKIRRKIKNKISAQESRRKKKEYVEALERKLHVCVQENMDLKRRNDSLENSNRSLLGQLRLMQQLMNKSKKSAVAVPPSSSGPDTLKNGHRGNSPAGGSASTCLMMFALCFAALLVGQPTNFSPRVTLDYGLTFGPYPHSFLNGLINSGPSKLVSSSLSQLGYTWSSSVVHRRCSASSPTESPIFGPHPPDVNFTINPLLAHTDHLAQRHWAGKLPTIHDSRVHSTAQFSEQPLNSPRSPPPPSLLLGSPNELRGCVAPPKPLWSYLFGSAFESERLGVCIRQDETDTEDTLMNAHIDVIESTSFKPERVQFGNSNFTASAPLSVHQSVSATDAVMSSLDTNHFPIHILITA